MASNLNQCQFIGRIGKDIELRYLPDGRAVANFSLAVNESWKEKSTGQKQEKVTWVNMIAFGKLAEIMGQYLSKGSKIYVSGKLKNRKWQDKSGADRYSTDIVISDMEMLDSKQGGSRQPEPPMAEPQGGAGDWDDDIPFD